MAVAFAREGGLAIKTTPCLLPGEVVYNYQVLAPEDGAAVGHGQHARVDETC